MILTVTLNAAVDKTYRVESFTLDRVHRPTEWKVVAGGKGINVARVHQALGGAALATGFLGGYNGRYIARSLDEEGIPSDFVRTGDESRVCIAVVDPVSGTQTEVNEVGPLVTASEVTALRRRFRKLVSSVPLAYAVLSGSIPPGVPDAIYADLTILARAAGVRSVLDASGEALRMGLDARPWMAKPNIHELAGVLGAVDDEPEALAAQVRPFVDRGVNVFCVTRGKQGAVCTARSEAWDAAPPAVRFVSAVGSGDAFLGAFLWALEQGQGFAGALRMGVGAGAANAAVYGAGFCSAEEIHRHARNVRMCRLAAGEVR